MKAIVVVESEFGNTRAVAEAVAEGLAAEAEVTVIDIREAPSAVADDVDLLVVGGPTHAFGMTRASTREKAAEQGGEAVDRGLREWLADLERPGRDVAVAAFDTKVKAPVPGSAAHKAERKLRRLGFHEAIAPETFYVDGVPGPLLPGEVERAREWGQQLASHATAAE